MRLLIVMTDFRIGGSQIAAVELARALAAQGHEIVVVAGRGDGADSVDTTGLATVELDKLSVLAVLRSVRDHGPELILSIEAATVLTCMAASRATSVPLAAYVLGPRIPWYLPHDLTVFVAMPRLLEFSQKLRNAHTHLLLPPVPIRALADRPAQGIEPLRVVSVGRLVEKYKGAGLRTLVRSMAHLPGARLDIVGDGPFREELEAEAAEVNRHLETDAIAFVGADNDPGARMAGADVVAASGMAIIEAATAGLPCVVMGRDGFAAPLRIDTVNSLMSSAFFGAGGPFDDPHMLAALLETTADQGADQGVRTILEQTYAPTHVAERLIEQLANVTFSVPRARSVARSYVERVHYRVRRRIIFERRRRHIQDVDALENEVNRMIREHPINRRARRLGALGRPGARPTGR